MSESGPTSPRPRRRFSKDMAVLVAMLVVASTAILAVLFLLPLHGQYTATLLSGESKLNVPAHSSVSISWITNGRLIPDTRTGYVTVAILPGPSEKLSDALNDPVFVPYGNFSFIAGTGTYYIWLYLGPFAGVNYTVSYSVPLLSFPEV